MDETPLWLDMPGDTTVSRVGERIVSIRSTGHDKARFTVVLVAMADGRKIKPYVVFKGVQQILELSRVPGVVVAYLRNGWMSRPFQDICWCGMPISEYYNNITFVLMLH